MSWRKGAIILLGIIFISTHASAATIRGGVYDGFTLEKVESSVVSVTTQPVQTLVTRDGDYSFEVGEGDYVLSAVQREDGIEIARATHEVEVKGDGEYVIDLILLPDLGEVPQEPLPEDEEPLTLWDQLTHGPAIWLGFLALVFVGIVGGLHVGRTSIRVANPHATKEVGVDVPLANEEVELDSHAREVLGHLANGGNRLTQKELRERVNMGEAKVSLIVSELESHGFVKKIKRGRGNILVLTEKGKEKYGKKD